MIDLHCHSTYSDGLLTPDALVNRAAGRGVKILALTDHDETSGLVEARASAYRVGLQLIKGVEISVQWNGSSVHIVGLNIDPDNRDLQHGLEFIRQSRIARAKKISVELENAGIKGSLVGACEYVTNSHMVGRAHFARFLCAQGYARDVKSVFDKYLAKGKPGYVAGIWASLAEAVGWIKGSGGVAVIAHPGRYHMDPMAMEAFISEFKKVGGEAIEVITPSHGKDQYRIFAAYAERFDLRASVGSDFHGTEESRFDLGELPNLPKGCTPVWQTWAGILH